MTATKSTHTRYLFTMLAVLVVASSLGAPPARATSDANISGTVIDAASGSTIGGICIFATLNGDVSAAAVSRGSDGGFELVGLGAGQYIVEGSDCVNYEPTHEPASVVVDLAEGEAATVNFELVPTGASSGPVDPPDGGDPEQDPVDDPLTDITFDDVQAGSIFDEAISWLASQGITNGCDSAGTLYCPGDAVTRGQMATFLVRALGLDPVADDVFADVAGVHEENINALSVAGITAGCDSAGTLYCPGDAVTRGQMAAFLYRALGGGDPSTLQTIVLTPPVITDPAGFIPQGACVESSGFTDHYVALPTYAGGWDYVSGYYNEPATWQYTRLYLYWWDGIEYRFWQSSNWFASVSMDGGVGADWYELVGSNWQYRGNLWAVSWADRGANPSEYPAWYRTAFASYNLNPYTGNFDLGQFSWIPDARWSGARWSDAYSACDMN